MYRKIPTYVIVLALLAITLGHIAPGLAPYAVTSPVSDSMDSTIAQTDVTFISTSSEYAEGDIILFESEQKDNEIIHRIVNETEEGYITQGDENAQSDQDEGLAPVQPDQIYGSVITVDGAPVTIPIIGSIVTSPVIVSVMWIIVTLLFATKSQRTKTQQTNASILSAKSTTTDTSTFTNARDRNEYSISQRMSIHQSVTENNAMMIILIIVVIASVPLVGVYTSVSDTATITTTERDDEHIIEQEDVTQLGSQTEKQITYQTPSLVGMTQAVTVDGSLSHGSTDSGPMDTETSITIKNTPRTEYTVDTATITIYTFPAVLPNSIVQSLTNIHPIIAGTATGATIVLYTAVLVVVYSWAKNRLKNNSLQNDYG